MFLKRQGLIINPTILLCSNHREVLSRTVRHLIKPDPCSTNVLPSLKTVKLSTTCFVSAQVFSGDFSFPILLTTVIIHYVTFCVRESCQPLSSMFCFVFSHSPVANTFDYKTRNMHELLSFYSIPY